MFNKNKIIQEKLKELEKKNNELKTLLESGDFLTTSVMKRMADLQANIIRTNLLSHSNVETDNITSVLDQIRRNEIPQEFAWDYWMLLDQTTDFWIGRYSEFEETDKYKKNSILTALRIGIKFGIAGIEKATGLPYYINLQNDGNYRCYAAKEMLDYNNEPFKKLIENNGKNKYYTINSDLNYDKILKPDELIVYTRRAAHIGDFVWYMKDLLTHIFNMYCINNAMLAVSPKLLCTTDGANNDAAIQNCKKLVDPFKPIKLIVSNESFMAGSSKQFIGQFDIYKNDQNKISGTEEMIQIMKVNYEEFCNKNGIPITSSKEQSLSSDANLSVFTGQCRTKALDNHVKDFFKELGIEINIDEPEMNQQNDNADKKGGGTANTDGDING